MKRCKLLALLILVCLLMLPVFATAETQQEFELRCNKKTATAASVYMYYTGVPEIVDSIPAGTYVIVNTTAGNESRFVTYMKNGIKKQETFQRFPARWCRRWAAGIQF